VCRQTTKSGIQEDCPLVLSDVFTTPNLSSESIINTDEQKSPDNTGLASQLRSELNKLANSLEYNGVVEDLYAFVKVFNERTPEYKSKLGPVAVLHNAEKQKAMGWK